jgi:hypothetical protein
MHDSTQTAAMRFEEEVASLYRLLGASVKLHVALAGQRLDMLVTLPKGERRTRTLAVECKFYRTLVGANSMNAFAAVVSSLRDNGIVQGGALVTNTGFTKVAIDIAAEFRVEALLIDQLRSMAQGSTPELFAGMNAGEPEEKIKGKKPYIFVVMPFAPEFDDVYALGIGPIPEKLGCVAERADDIEHNLGVLEVLQQKIRDCDIVVADTTGLNPNVLYEVGFAHAIPQDVVLIQRTDSKELPFDIRGQNCIFYPNIVHLRERLERRLRATLTSKQPRPSQPVLRRENPRTQARSRGNGEP